MAPPFRYNQVLQVALRTAFGPVSAICPKMGRLSIQIGEEFGIFLGIGRKSA